MKLSSILFWDTDISKINWDKSQRYVIARVVMYGTIEDWKTIKNYYGLDKIKEAMLQERELDNRSLSFLSCLFNIPKENFRCYKERQLHPLHWNS